MVAINTGINYTYEYIITNTKSNRNTKSNCYCNTLCSNIYNTKT